MLMRCLMIPAMCSQSERIPGFPSFAKQITAARVSPVHFAVSSCVAAISLTGCTAVEDNLLLVAGHVWIRVLLLCLMISTNPRSQITRQFPQLIHPISWYATIYRSLPVLQFRPYGWHVYAPWLQPSRGMPYCKSLFKKRSLFCHFNRSPPGIAHSTRSTEVLYIGLTLSEGVYRDSAGLS